MQQTFSANSHAPFAPRTRSPEDINESMSKMWPHLLAFLVEFFTLKYLLSVMHQSTACWPVAGQMQSLATARDT